MKKYIAEFLGTFWLVLGGCGSAVFAAVVALSDADLSNGLGLGFLGVSLAFGLTVVTGAYAFGHISGGHFNPAVSFGLWAAKRFPGHELLPYIVAQVLGGALAGLVILVVGSGNGALDLSGSNPLATNGFGSHSPGGYGLLAALITEIVMTFMFLMIILGSTDRRAPAGFAPVAIGLGLTLIHLISIPITNTSVNPARSTGVALFCGNVELIGQLWLFWVAPIFGAIAAGYAYSAFFSETKDITGTGAPTIA
ncbi:aquaporin Z [Picosynechococcus sp. PCC 8807]|uniref:aquaporin Z n=1 Tax=Picosynechococcus sp. PCC 8807 TaxID=195248 RepID=UPI0008105B4C|nr:aquaporin Z [Picosynechococcus sp. PCC 8807]ANV91366.1 aquaporin Z [Picosynechococcus sp. PCC 8807]